MPAGPDEFVDELVTAVQGTYGFNLTGAPLDSRSLDGVLRSRLVSRLVYDVPGTGKPFASDVSLFTHDDLSPFGPDNRSSPAATRQPLLVLIKCEQGPAPIHHWL